MLKVLFWLFLFGLIFRVVFSYLLPLLRITSAAGRQMRAMQQKMQEMEQKMNEPKVAPKTVQKEGDYIEYEELK